MPNNTRFIMEVNKSEKGISMQTAKGKNTAGLKTKRKEAEKDISGQNHKGKNTAGLKAKRKEAEKILPMLEAKDLSFRYQQHTPWILRNLSFSIGQGERVALLGDSGCGKSTLSKILAGYLKPTKGEVLWKGQPLPEKGYCPVQWISQHPEQSVNPRWKMDKILRESWNPTDSFLSKLQIEKEWLKRWPIELSGGELQRFSIARVLGPKTEFLICDEISTMLDVATQAQIWQVLLEESRRRGLGMLVVTHNLALAQRVADRIMELK